MSTSVIRIYIRSLASAVRARRFVGSLASRAVSRARERAVSADCLRTHWLAGARQDMRVRIPSYNFSDFTTGYFITHLRHIYGLHSPCESSYHLSFVFFVVIIMVSVLWSVKEPLAKPSVGDGVESRRPCSVLHFLSINFFMLFVYSAPLLVCAINQ